MATRYILVFCKNQRVFSKSFCSASKYIVGLLNNYIFIIIKHMILYIFYFKDSVIRL